MIDEEIVTNDTEDYTPEPEPAPEPMPEPAPEPAPAPEPSPEPEEPAAPVEVVTVEDLLDRLTGASQEETEEPSQEPETEEELPAEDFGGLDARVTFDGGPIEVVGMDTVLKRLETIQQAEDHPALTTPFEDYTVTEGLLLLLFLSVFAMACVRLLKGGFAWLR